MTRPRTSQIATEHIRSLTRHFDSLIRNSVVSANETAGYLATLKAE
jgi:hypothetical protein